jgi:hypothetical protein
MSGSSDFVTILLEPKAENSAYRSRFNDVTDPIYLIGESVVGQCRFTSPNGDKTKHRGISIRLIGKYQTQGVTISDFSVQDQRIADSGSLSSGAVIPFTFDRPPVIYPSYNGQKYCLTYFLVVDVKLGLFSKISKAESIVLLEPTRSRPQLHETILPISQPPIYFRFRIDRQSYATDEMINGELRFGRVPQTELQAVTVCLVLVETCREGSRSRSEFDVLTYELVDGSPPPGITIPFFIQLAPLRLWTTKNNQASVITAEFRLDVFIKKNNTDSCACQHSIQIYQRAIADAAQADSAVGTDARSKGPASN